MKRQLIRSLSLITILVSLLLGFQNCSKVQFTTSNGSLSSYISGGGNCNLETLTVPIKTLFVVDISGSNSEPSAQGTGDCVPGGVCDPATDPTKQFRGGSISEFYDLYQSKTNFSWGFEVFSAGKTANIFSYVNSNGGTPDFGNSSAMATALKDFYAETDGGGTPYLEALSFAQNIIQNDPDLHSSAAHPPIYNVIFMSDGYPNESSLSGTLAQNETLIDSAIQGITSLAPGRINFSAVYYGTVDDPNAESLIQNMASTGGGQFLVVPTQTTATIPIAYLITIPTGDCQ